MSNQYVVANWKMNGSFAQIQVLMNQLSQTLHGHEDNAKNVIVCPPVPYLQFVQNRLAEWGWQLGAQDCSNQVQGAYTGQISASMLKDIGCSHVIIGHSERRQYCHESNGLIAGKLQRCLESHLVPILCVGETLAEYEAGQTLEIIAAQIKETLCDVTKASSFMIAYEPLWSIGTGKVANHEEIISAHGHIGTILHQLSFVNDIPILYGGSVNGENATAIMRLKSVDGVLVGGASLKAQDFSHIVANLT